MLNVTNIPAARVPFVDSDTGLMTREWYRFFYNIFLLSGGGTNQTTLEDLQTGPLAENATAIVQNLIDYVGPDYQYQFQELANDIQSLALQPPTLPQTSSGSVTSVDTSGNLIGGPITSSGTITIVQNPTFTTSVTSPLQIGGTTASSSLTLQSTTGVGTTDSIIFKVGNNGATTAGTFDTNGNLLVGTTTQINVGVGSQAGCNLNKIGQLVISADSDTNYFRRTGTDGNILVFYKGTSAVGGISVTTTGTTYAVISDYRLKENVMPMTTGLGKISALKPVTYDWISNKSQGEGFIAHELQTVIPLAVTGEKNAVDKDGNPVHQGVDYSKIVVHLVAAIQELSANSNALEARLAALEAKQGV